MIRKIIYTLSIIFIQCVNAASQDCEVPDPPELDLVSVDPLSGYVRAEWTASPSADIDAYILYWYDKDINGWKAIDDTIWNPSATAFTYVTPATKYNKIDFSVAAYRLSATTEEGCPSRLSNPLTTIFLDAVIDSCKGLITLSWNRYTDPDNPVSGYQVMVSVNNSGYVDSYYAGPESERLTITDLPFNSEYSFYIRAILNNGESTSNKKDISAHTLRPPQWINADYASVEGNNISVSFTIDPSSEIKKYRLERSEQNGAWSPLDEFYSDSYAITYSDDQIIPGKIYLYKLSALNGCNEPVVTSNSTKNIKLTANYIDDMIQLNWNYPQRLSGSMLEYIIFGDTGDGYMDLNSVSDTTLLMRSADIIYNVNKDEICFLIKASESANPYGINSIISSSVACLDLPVIINVPNIFTPDNDLVNDHFFPVISFTPAEYLIIITDRQGKTLFESGDHLEKWDGSYRGEPQREGVYLWYLRLKGPSGEIITKRGTVTIIR